VSQCAQGKELYRAVNDEWSSFGPFQTIGEGLVQRSRLERLLPFTDALPQHGDQPKAVIGRTCTLFNRTADIWWVAAVFARQNQGNATKVRFRRSRIGAADPKRV
jgi:hypothetical protein